MTPFQQRWKKINMNEQKNLFLAIAISIAIIVVFQFFLPGPITEPIQNKEGESLLDFAMANNLTITNTHFKKRLSHLITYKSGPFSSQVDYILIKKKHLKLVKDTKIIPGEECVPQHNLLASLS